jgi:hypothetical protein
MNTNTTPHDWDLKSWRIETTYRGGIILPNRLSKTFHDRGLSAYQRSGSDTFLVLQQIDNGVKTYGSFTCVDQNAGGTRTRFKMYARFKSTDDTINWLLGNRPSEHKALQTQAPISDRQTTLATSQLPPELQEQLDRFLEIAPEWSEDRVMTASISMFLMQDKRSNNRTTSRIYLDALFKVPVESFEEVAA